MQAAHHALITVKQVLRVRIEMFETCAKLVKRNFKHFWRVCQIGHGAQLDFAGVSNIDDDLTVIRRCHDFNFSQTTTQILDNFGNELEPGGCDSGIKLTEIEPGLLFGYSLGLGLGGGILGDHRTVLGNMFREFFSTNGSGSIDDGLLIGSAKWP